MGSPPSCAAAAIMPNGLVAVCRVPGIPNLYKAELVGLLLWSHLSGEGDRLQLDCQGAVPSAKHIGSKLLGTAPPRCLRALIRFKGTVGMP